MKVTLTRSGVEKVIHATPEHRWYINPRSRAGYKYDHKAMVHTQDLAEGSRLAPLFPVDRLRKNVSTRPSPFGIAHGFTYGDGNLTGRGGSQVTLWGVKDQALLPYFAASHTVETETGNGTKGVTVKDLPSFFKEFPSRSESLSYLYGWLAGYFAADGSVGEAGAVGLYCADRGVLEWVRDLCTQLGIGTYGITGTTRSGFGENPTPIWRLNFVVSTLTSDFFLVPEHRARIEGRTGYQEQVGWTVKSVEETDRVEEVYCAVVPGHENFTLADNINVMNCNTGFTVQIQPQYPSFPQTVDGMPLQVPGMPYGGENANVPAGDPAMDPMAAGGDPMAEEGAEGQEEAPAEEGSSETSDSENPFAKNSFKTASGAELDLDHYLQHLALQHLPNREAVLDRIRGENRSA